MRTLVVGIALLSTLAGSLPAQGQLQRRLEIGGLYGTTQIGEGSRYPGESAKQSYIGLRTDWRFMRLGPGLVGAALFWDTYRYEEVVSFYCDPGPCTMQLDPQFPPAVATGRRDNAARLGGGLTWQVPLGGGFSGDVGASAGRFARTIQNGSGLSALADKATSRSFLGAEAGVSWYWRSVSLGAGYEYDHSWRVRGSKPTAHRLRMRLAYALPYN